MTAGEIYGAMELEFDMYMEKEYMEYQEPLELEEQQEDWHTP